MERVVIFGRGGAGKSVLAVELGRVAELPVVELDTHFWNEQLAPLSNEEWTSRQRDLVVEERWILDGDLGPYDVVEPRLRRCDTVIMLDFPVGRCVWRVWRRGSEQREFWTWMLNWRRRSRPGILTAIATFAPHAKVLTLRSPRDVREFLTSVACH